MTLTCSRCRDSFEGRDTRSRYCSDACRKDATRELERKRRNPQKPCIVCGTLFQSLKTRGRYVTCSDECFDRRTADSKSRRQAEKPEYNRAYREKNADALREYARRPDVVERRKERSRQRYAESQAVRLKAIEEAKRYYASRKNDPVWRAKRNARYHRRRARVRGNGPADHFTRDEVFARDQHCCQLCGQNTAGYVFPDPRSPVLGHIIPIERGGPHTLDNTRCECLTCSSRKGSKFDSDLSLPFPSVDGTIDGLLQSLLTEDGDSLSLV